MAQPSDTFLAFAEQDFYRFAENQMALAHAQVDRIAESDLRQADTDSLVEQIVGAFTINAPTLDFDNVQKTTSDRAVEDTSGFAALIGRGSGLVTRQVITYHIPLTGDPRLLRYRPSTYSLSAPTVYVQGTVNGSTLCFDVIRPSNRPDQMQQDLERVRSEAEQTMNQLRTSSARLAEDISKFNAALRGDVPNRVAARKQRLQGNQDFLSQL